MMVEAPGRPIGDHDAQAPVAGSPCEVSEQGRALFRLETTMPVSVASKLPAMSRLLTRTSIILRAVDHPRDLVAVRAARAVLLTMDVPEARVVRAIVAARGLPDHKLRRLERQLDRVQATEPSLGEETRR